MKSSSGDYALGIFPCSNKPKLNCSCIRSGVCNNINPLMKVKKSNGEIQDFDWSKIKAFYDRVASELSEVCPYIELEDNLKNMIVDLISTEDINNIIVKSARDLISSQNTKWEFIAGRFAVRILYKKWARSNGLKHHEDKYNGDSLYNLIKEYTDRGLYNKRILETYSEEDIKELAKDINIEYDYNYNLNTINVYNKRYLLNINGEIKELPQHMYLINAMFLGIPEKDESRLDFVKALYHSTASGEISLPTPTLLNARTENSQLSSCFILTLKDDLRSIYHNIENMAQISKNGGGLGVYMGNVRARGSFIKNIIGLSGGVMPWVKVINDTAIAVNQLGKRAGAISVTLDVFHYDIYEWLDMQTETGDIRRKAFDVFPAVSFPDLFFRRLEEDGKWTTFCPKEIEDKYGKRLQDFFGEEFDKFYEELENDTELKVTQKHSAKDLFKKFLKSNVETGMPYTFFRDTVNRLNPNKHCGAIYCSNLCTEIAQNQSENTFIVEEEDNGIIDIRYQSGDTVICNLASINVAKVNTNEQLSRVVPIAMRCLDNVIDLNAYPVQEAKITAKKYRAVGLGTLGLAQYLAESKLLYGSPEAIEEVDRLYKDLAFHTLQASVSLAKERGAYPAFEGSEYSKGIAFGDTVINKFGATAEAINLSYNMQIHGTRFGYHSSPAPNTSTAVVVGTTAGVVPVFKKIFIETNKQGSFPFPAPNLNPENFWFYPEYVSMDLPKVIDTVSTIQKYTDQSVSFEWLIDVGKLSPKNLYEYYLQAWKGGLKTIYYTRSQTKQDIEDCASCSG